MSLTLDDVRRVASLARLELSDEEASRLLGELSKILEFAESIRALDTSDVPPTTHAIELTDVFREDAPQASLDRERVLAQAPSAEDGCFIAPRIV